MKRFVFLFSLVFSVIFFLFLTPSKASAQSCGVGYTLCGGLCYSYDACGYGSTLYCDNNVAKCWAYSCLGNYTACNGACWPNYQGYTLYCPNYVLTSCPTYNNPNPNLCGGQCWANYDGWAFYCDSGVGKYWAVWCPNSTTSNPNLCNGTCYGSCPSGSTFSCVGGVVSCKSSPPTVDLKMDFSDGPLTVTAGSHIFTWTSLNTTSCSLSSNPYNSGWTTPPSPPLNSSSYSVLMNVSGTYTITCYSSSGASASDTVSVTINSSGLTATQQTCQNGLWVATPGSVCVAKSSCTSTPPCTLGCDGVCNSGKINDKCGVCGGDGTTCAPGGGSCTTCPAGQVCGSFVNNCGTTLNCGTCGAGSTCNGTSCVSSCGNGICDAGESSATCPADCGYTLSGTIRTDTLGNQCASGATAFTTPTNVVATKTDVSPTTTTTAQSNASGTFSFSSLRGGAYNVALSVPQGYKVVAIDGAATNSTSKNISVPPVGSITFCISSVSPWYQVDTGDVRIPRVSNPVPAGKVGASDSSYPGIFFSSNFTSNFGLGSASVKNWKVDDEYSYKKNSLNRNGSVSYDYYKNRASSTGQTILPLSGCTNGVGASCTVSLTGLTTGIYEFDAGGTGKLTINDYTQVSGAHVTVLVNGSVDIASKILVPAGNKSLFILAAKKDIKILGAVGADPATPSSTETSLAGIYSAQGKIIADGTGCAGTADRRLNVEGVFIANALKPFTTGGAGNFENKRSLCASDGSYPSVSFKNRPDFIFQLSDFYKVPFFTWKQVNP